MKKCLLSGLLVVALSATVEAQVRSSNYRKGSASSVWKYKESAEKLCEEIRDDMENIAPWIDDEKEIKRGVKTRHPSGSLTYQKWINRIGYLRDTNEAIREISPVPEKIQLADRMLVNSSYEFDEALNFFKEWLSTSDDKAILQAEYKFMLADSMRSNALQQIRQVIDQSKSPKKYIR